MNKSNKHKQKNGMNPFLTFQNLTFSVPVGSKLDLFHTIYLALFNDSLKNKCNTLLITLFNLWLCCLSTPIKKPIITTTEKNNALFFSGAPIESIKSVNFL